jgi:hypothetical protein
MMTDEQRQVMEDWKRGYDASWQDLRRRNNDLEQEVADYRAAIEGYLQGRFDQGPSRTHRLRAALRAHGIELDQ